MGVQGVHVLVQRQRMDEELRTAHAVEGEIRRLWLLRLLLGWIGCLLRQEVRLLQDWRDRQGQVVVALFQLHGHLAKRLCKSNNKNHKEHKRRACEHFLYNKNARLRGEKSMPYLG